ncbi:MAG TPA: hypothetical protein VJH33_01275 [Candidatus Paceibacterota bacterium]
MASQARVYSFATIYCGVYLIDSMSPVRSRGRMRQIHVKQVDNYKH